MGFINIQQHISNIRQYVDKGFEKIILHKVERNQEEFIRVFGEKFLSVSYEIVHALTDINPLVCCLFGYVNH